MTEEIIDDEILEAVRIPRRYAPGIIPPTLRASFISRLAGVIKEDEEAGECPAALRGWDTTDIFDILRLWRDNSTSKYYCTMLVIFEAH
jgi:hypothetical protein